jgi:hypothetical protein
MESFLEFPIGRLWRLTVRKKNIRTEYLVPDVRLGEFIDQISWDANVQDLQCTPYHSTAHEGIWMASRPPSEQAA